MYSEVDDNISVKKIRTNRVKSKFTCLSHRHNDGLLVKQKPIDVLKITNHYLLAKSIPKDLHATLARSAEADSLQVCQEDLSLT